MFLFLSALSSVDPLLQCPNARSRLQRHHNQLESVQLTVEGVQLFPVRCRECCRYGQILAAAAGPALEQDRRVLQMLLDHGPRCGFERSIIAPHHFEGKRTGELHTSGRDAHDFNQREIVFVSASCTAFMMTLSKTFSATL